MTQYIMTAIGGAGVKIGIEFTKQMTNHFNIDQDGILQNDQLNKLDTVQLEKYFQLKETNKSGQLKCLPHIIFLDNDEESLNQMYFQGIQNIVDQSNLVIQIQSEKLRTCNYNNNEFLEQYQNYIEALRKYQEKIDYTSYQSISSFTGSFSSSFQKHLALSYERPDRNMQFSIMPDFQNEPYSVVQLYNFMLGYNPTEGCQISFMFQNTALERIQNYQFIQNKSLCPYDNVNQLSGKIIYQVVLPFFSKSQMSFSQRKLATNMVAFPRLSQCLVNYYNSDYDLKSSSNSQNLDHEETILQQLKNKNSCCFNNVDLMSEDTNNPHRIFTNMICTSGSNINEITFQENCQKYINQIIDYRLFQGQQCISPTNYCFNYGQKNNYQSNAFLFAVSSNTSEYYKNYTELFTSSFRRHAYLHLYSENGIDAMDFTEAESNLNDLISEYSFLRSDQNDMYSEEQGYYDEE